MNMINDFPDIRLKIYAQIIDIQNFEKLRYHCHVMNYTRKWNLSKMVLRGRDNTIGVDFTGKC